MCQWKVNGWAIASSRARQRAIQSLAEAERRQELDAGDPESPVDLADERPAAAVGPRRAGVLVVDRVDRHDRAKRRGFVEAIESAVLPPYEMPQTPVRPVHQGWSAIQASASWPSSFRQARTAAPGHPPIRRSRGSRG